MFSKHIHTEVTEHNNKCNKTHYNFIIVKPYTFLIYFNNKWLDFDSNINKMYSLRIRGSTKVKKSALPVRYQSYICYNSR